MAQAKHSSDIGIIGYGQSTYYKSTDRTLISLLAEASRKAAESAGVKPREIDGLAVSSFMLPPDNAVTIAEHFGLSPSWANFFTAGGAGSVSTIADGMRAIRDGKAKYVLCVAGDAYNVKEHFARAANWSVAIRNFSAPHCSGGPKGFFAIVQRKHMREYGTTRAQLGKISIGQRESARLNPNALLRGPLTLDDYLNARLIADPLRLYDCVLPCTGAEAVLLGPLDRAADGKGVRVLSAHEKHNYPAGDLTPLKGGWEAFKDALYDDAGYGPGDMDFVQAYDDFPIMVAIQLEDLGFCRKGEVGPFLERHSVAWNGSFPVNTGGGQLSCGQTGAGGGMIGVFEAVAQLRNEAGERQIDKARRGLVSGYGMIGFGHGLSSSAAILESVWQ